MKKGSGCRSRRKSIFLIRMETKSEPRKAINPRPRKPMIGMINLMVGFGERI